MGHRMRCPCQNVTLYLEVPPLNQEGLQWVKEEFKLTKGIGKATLASMAGFVAQVPDICRTRTITKDMSIWKCIECCNCDTFICCHKATVDSTVYVNMALPLLKDAQMQTGISSNFYSSVWKIILNDEDDCTNSVLEPPDMSDSARYEKFKLLEKELQDYLFVEEKKMRDRIREYEQKQLEELRECQSRAYRDRKVLWNRFQKTFSGTNTTHNAQQVVTETISLPEVQVVVDPNASLAPPVNNTTASLGVAPEEPKVVVTTSPPDSSTTPVTATDATSTTAKPSTVIVEKAATTWKTSTVTDKHSESSDWLFQFDEDEGKSDLNEDEENDSPPAELEENDSVEVDYEDFYDPRPSQYQIASSVPVTIPNLPAKYLSTEKQSKEKSLAQTLGQSNFDTPEARSHADQELLSKSFAVPMSRNRVRGWL